MRIVADRIGHRFRGGDLLFANLTFALTPGKLIGLIGPSGSGKSTLLSIISGVAKPAVGSLNAYEVERTGWILQNPVGVPRRVAIDQVAFPFLLRGFSRARAEEEAMELLTVFGLSHISDRQYRHLSGGEAQRLSFARAVAADYGAILLDEPTAQLDPRTAQSVREVIRGLVSSTRIVVIATHDQALRGECDELIDLGMP